MGIMAKQILSIGFLVICLSLFGQIADNTNRKNIRNVYNQSFLQYLKYLKTNKSKIPDTIFVDSNPVLTDSLMTQILKTKIIVLGESELKNILTKRRIVLYKLFPLEYRNNDFHVSFVPFGASYNDKTNEENLINGGGYWVRFLFEKRKFIFKKFNEYGI
jgi:hypothetical protein